MKRNSWPVMIAISTLLLATLACGSSGTATKTPQATDLIETPAAAGPAAAATAKPVTSVPTRSPSAAKGPTVKSAANLRAGPGTDYAKTGSAAVGQELDIIGRNQAGDWYQLRGGAWIAAFLVANAPVVPVADNIPTPAAAAPVPVRAATIPIPAVSGNAFTCAGGCAVAPDPSCAIKGNVNSDGVKIYHTRGQQNYDDTDIKPEEGDLWFCTEAEARAAGFRAAQR